MKRGRPDALEALPLQTSLLDAGVVQKLRDAADAVALMRANAECRGWRALDAIADATLAPPEEEAGAKPDNTPQEAFLQRKCFIGASAAKALELAEAARESTFDFLEGASAPAHSAAYAAASCFVAEAHLLRAFGPERPTILGGAGLAQQEQAHRAKEAEAAAAAHRALDLAMLRGGVDEWRDVAAPLVRAADAMAAAAAGPSTRGQARDEGGGAGADAAAGEGSGAAAGEAEADEGEADEGEADPRLGACRAIPRVDARTLDADAFRRLYMETTPPRPVILTHAIGSWPALSSRPWSDLGYLQAQAGGRLVPVETYAAEDSSRTYLSDSW